MANHPQLLLQERVYDILTGDATLMGLVSNRIYDNVPEQTSHPYLTMGDIELGDWGGHDFDGVEGDVTIRAWSRARGREEARTILNRVYALLHNTDLGVTGFPTITCRCILTQVLPDPDGRTHQGVQRYRVILGGN